MINQHRHTQKTICYLMLYHGIVGCTDINEKNPVLEYCENLLNAEKNPKKKLKTLQRADKIIRKMFDQVKDFDGNNIIAAICLTLNKLSTKGYEIFSADEPIADLFDVIAAKAIPLPESEIISNNWLVILNEYFSWHLFLFSLF